MEKKEVSSFKTVLFLIFRDVKTYRKMVALLVLAISIGAANYAVMMGFMTDFVDKMIDRTVNTHVGHIIVEPLEDKKYISGIKTVEKKILLIPGVTGISPRIDTDAIIGRKNELETCTLQGITPSKEDTVTILSKKIKEGSFISDKDRENIVIGNKLADKIKAKLGDKVRITYRNGERRDYIIKGIIHTDLDEIDSNMVIVGLDEIKDVLNLGDQATEIVIRTTNLDNVDNMKYLIMQQNVHGKVKTWKDKLAFILAVIELSKDQMALFGGITLFAAAVAIVVMMYITVINRTHEIGILKAIGGRNSFILYVFLGEAIVIGLLGTIFGNILGFFIIKYFELNPIYDPIYGYISAVYDLNVGITSSVVTMVTCILAGIYPAIKASRLNVIEAIRGM
ncbi:MAG: ABC transporter permease [Candidatus Hydrothermarchaeota archaeon]